MSNWFRRSVANGKNDKNNTAASQDIRLTGKKKAPSDPGLLQISCRDAQGVVIFSETFGLDNFPIGISNRRESSVKSCIVCSSPDADVNGLQCIIKIKDETLWIYNNDSAHGLRINGSQRGSERYPVKQRSLTLGVGWLSFHVELLPPIAPYLSKHDVTVLIENIAHPEKETITALVKNNTTIGRVKSDILLKSSSISRFFAYVRLNETSCRMISVVDADVFERQADGTKCREVELTEGLVFRSGGYRFAVLTVFNGYGFETEVQEKQQEQEGRDAQETDDRGQPAPLSKRSVNPFDRRTGEEKPYVYVIGDNADEGTPILRFTFSGPLPQEIAPVEVTDNRLRIYFTSLRDAVKGSQIVLSDKKLGVEQSHCYLEVRDKQIYIADNGSDAGTKVPVNGRVSSLSGEKNEMPIEATRREFSFSIGFLTVHCKLLPGIAEYLNDRYVKLRITNIRNRSEQPFEAVARDGNRIGRANSDIPLTDSAAHRRLGRFSIVPGSAKLTAMENADYFTLENGQTAGSVDLKAGVKFKSGPYHFEVLEFFDGLSFE